LFCVGYVSENSKSQDLDEADLIVQHFDELNYSRISAL